MGETWEQHLKPIPNIGVCFVPRKFVKCDVQISRFCCILTAIKSCLVLASDWVFSGRGVKQFLIGFVQTPLVAVVSFSAPPYSAVIPLTWPEGWVIIVHF